MAARSSCRSVRGRCIGKGQADDPLGCTRETGGGTDNGLLYPVPFLHRESSQCWMPFLDLSF